jgi:hypothetical protein
LTFPEIQPYHWSVSGPVEAFINSLAKYSWRTLFGIFVAAGATLFLPDQLGVTAWALPLHGYLMAAFILSGAVLSTHLVTTVYALVRKHRNQRIDLRMVAGSPLHSNWSVSLEPGGKKPMLIIMCTMNFAHKENVSVIIKRGYLKGTKAVFPTNDIVVEGAYDPPASICMGVSPVKAKPGQKLTGRLVFVDQFNGKHKSEEITFSPNTVPSDLQVNRLKTSPNCVFCNQPVKLEDQAQEAQMTAHTTCIWP